MLLVIPAFVLEVGAIFIFILQGRKRSSHSWPGHRTRNGKGDLTLKPVFMPLVYISLLGWEGAEERKVVNAWTPGPACLG